MFGRKDPTSKDTGALPPATSSEEAAEYESERERIAEAKRRALADPGPSWRAWFLHDNSRWWIGLGFLIVDSWIFGYFVETGEILGLVPALVGAVFLEYLATLYLWHRPSDKDLERPRGQRRPWWSPFPYGRWTPEADRARAGKPALLPPGESTPDANEFL